MNIMQRKTGCILKRNEFLMQPLQVPQVYPLDLRLELSIKARTLMAYGAG